MAKFAVIEGSLVTNTILAESKEIAEAVTNKTCIEYTDEPAEVGGTYSNGVFTPTERPVTPISTEE